ncbi:MAG: TIGR03790 family protein [Verrucomicrobiota bacterium]
MVGPLRILLFALLAGLPCAHALAPHEVLVLVNRNDASSLELANHLVHLRQVPANNVVSLALPDNRDIVTIKPAEFTQWIWDPVNKVIAERGLEKEILAWVYSSGFPTTIASQPEMSITGLTFTRNRIPGAVGVDSAVYTSPLFRGPERKGGPTKPTASLDKMKVELDDKMPLPAMMLGYTWHRGNEPALLVNMIQRGVMADGTRPKGTVYFVFMDDIRFETRLWQMLEARNELKSMGIAAEISNRMPDRATDRISGLMTGTQYLEIDNVSNIYPGSMCDHLTSFGARYQTHLQSKASAWFRAGATASSGTVTEPMAVWEKFPHARYYVHAAKGCSILESFYQSVYAPLQLLILGEPFSRPYGKLIGIALDVEGQAVKVRIGGLDPHTRAFYHFFVDGKRVGRLSTKPEYTAGDLAPGAHEWQVVVVADGAISHYATARKGFTVAGEVVRWPQVPASGELRFAGQRTLRVETDPAPRRFRIWKNGRALYEAKGGAYVDVELGAKRLGKGPSRLVAEAVFDDHSAWSRPVTLVLE